MIDMWPRFKFINMNRSKHRQEGVHHINASASPSAHNAQYEWDLFSSVGFHNPYPSCNIGDQKLFDF